jgi:hypothetical protein
MKEPIRHSDIYDMPDVGGNNRDHDNRYVRIYGESTIYDEKTFNSFPLTPSAAPDADYEVANKKYVDDKTQRAVGNGTRSAATASGSLTAVTLSFTPTLVEFEFFYIDGDGNLSHFGSGYSDGSTHGSSSVWDDGAGSYTVLNSLSYCIIVYDSSSSDRQDFTCAIGSNNFTLSHTKTGSPTGNIVWKYKASN